MIKTNQAGWEKKKVKFHKSRCIGMSLSGAMGQERDSWTAYYKKKYLTGGSPSIEHLVEYMNQKQERIAKRIKLIDEGKA
jgi:hypothetical protein